MSLDNHLIRAEFRLRTNSKNDWVYILKQDIPQVPSIGHTVSLDGNPYLVADVGWAIYTSVLGGYVQTHAIVTVSKLYDFKEN